MCAHKSKRNRFVTFKCNKTENGGGGWAHDFFYSEWLKFIFLHGLYVE
jgi:hypothetical protein